MLTFHNLWIHFVCSCCFLFNKFLKDVRNTSALFLKVMPSLEYQNNRCYFTTFFLLEAKHKQITPRVET